MALTPPTLAEFSAFRGGDPVAAGEEATRVELVLSQATDVLWVFTQWESYPADPRLARISKNAVLDLTLWILAQYEHRDEINSPFSSERIGSYSYSKMQQARTDFSSGIFWLDMLFRALSAPGSDGESAWVSTEYVFNPGGESYADQQRRLREEYFQPDPPIAGWF